MNNKNKNSKKNSILKIPNESPDIDLQKIYSQNNQYQNNSLQGQVQNPMIPNYNYPPLMQNPQMMQNDQPQKNQDYYIDFQMPQMNNSNIQSAQEIQPPQICPQNVDGIEFDVEKKIQKNIQTFNTDYTPKTQKGQQGLQSALCTADNLDQQIQTNTTLNPIQPTTNTQTYQFQQTQKKQKEKQEKDKEKERDKERQRKRNNQDLAQVIIEIPLHPIAESTYDNKLRASKLTGLVRTDTKKKRQTKNKNKISHSIVESTDHHVYYHTQVVGYHTTVCCCGILHPDDCCLKWLCDLIFYFFYLPLRLLSYLLQKIFNVCCKSSSTESYSNCFKDFFYSPFRCFGDWANQCWFSWNNFCCQGISFMPSSVQSIYTNCCQMWSLQVGQFFKNCCTFPAENKCCKTACPACTVFSKLCENSNGEFCCSSCFQCCGDCCQNCCSPQGFFEDIFNCCKQCSCEIISKDCVQCLCCCCVQIQKVQIGQEVGELLKCCCCCICETIGSILDSKHIK